jgi:hypothetical protein
MIKECWTKVLMVEIKRKRFKLRIIFGRNIDTDNKNNEKSIMKKIRIRFFKFSDGKQNLQFHWP